MSNAFVKKRRLDELQKFCISRMDREFNLYPTNYGIELKSGLNQSGGG